MDVPYVSENLVEVYQSAWRHIQKDNTFHSNYPENLKFQM
jgi:hypothetical protein